MGEQVTVKGKERKPKCNRKALRRWGRRNRRSTTISVQIKFIRNISEQA